jgi:signal transduction histidine kinase
LSETADKLDENGKMYLTRIQQIGLRMQELINDILEFSKITGEKDIFEQVDLNQLLDELVIEMDVAVNEKRARIVIDTLPSLYVNRSLMRPLFSNLIGNALKYSKKEVAPLIQIRSEMSSPEREGHPLEKTTRYCRILIEDNGLGFEQKYAEQIFDMFRRLRSNAEGTGIGLALCKRIVEKHNGFISARSKVNEGATFIVSLPFLFV